MDKNYLNWWISLLAVIVLTAGLVLFEEHRLEDKTSPISTQPPISYKKPNIDLVLTGTGFTSPTAIISTNQKQDKRLFVVERPGTVKSFTPGTSGEKQLFLDISSKVLESGEMGLLGMAFHPDFKNNGYFFINYIDLEQNTVIARYTLPKGAGQADANSEKVLIKFKQPYTNHNGGDLQFGPEGLLYIALGDGGSQGDPQDNAQNKNTLFGKILRVDVDKGDPYSIPATNPFAGQSDAKQEVWAYGLRNPWRISFDEQAGDLYIADVGQGAIEEINVQKAGSRGGENYGWRCREGTKSFNENGCSASTQYIEPAFEYDHEEDRCSVTGGYVYRGTSDPALVGKYFYGDFCSGQLFYAQNNAGKWQQTMALKSPYAISAFGQDSDNRLYLSDFSSGNIYKIEDTAN